VLPTLAEGCCNSIVEAMACGLPIISSDLPFNDDILDDNNSIRIDPNSIREIRDAIKQLIDNPELMKNMSIASTRSAKDLTIEKRVKNIIEFIDHKIS
jgi:glycosyltransferase involved in cell wall biosynthesis